ncbi:MAG: isoprenylcysteine carboxylmethyltransferase family protein [Steroidobacteraceae bacterium]
MAISTTSAGVATKSRMPPPLPCLIGVIFGALCGWISPWPIGRYVYVLPFGIVLVIAVVASSIAVARAFKRHGTSPDPAHETTAIIDTGPFRFSRNPVYVTMALLQAAVGCLLNNEWILLLTLPALLVIHYVVVLREEAYLERRFGQVYLAYKARVRRWL